MVVVSPPAVEVQGLAVERGGADVLRGVSFTIAQGQRVGLIGPNGAGKTTLFLSLLGLHPRAAGTVRVCGLDPARKDEAQRIRCAAGLVFQNADDQLFCGTVTDDVSFGPLQLGLDSGEVGARVRAALAAVNAEHLRDQLAHALSAGEKRRAALATALAMQPRILLLDEPTGELDPRARRGLIELLNSRSETLLVATHDLEFVLATCTRVVVLSGGGVAADGPARDVMARAELMDRAGLEVPYSLR
ncbi:MAG TPA: energy-coupling factor ABC transporter ATP-binding protein [Phycisphaerae bacterium]|nr:energy-coupling factor ABC transporter ATP-binding protein [Phycisphaerae bacterium]